MTTSAPAVPDLKSLIEWKSGISFIGRPSNHHRLGSKEHHGPCPWCGGRDRFVVFSDVNWYHCIRGCGRKGDSLQFLRDYCNMTYREACDELGIDPRYPQEARPPVVLPLEMLRDDPPCAKWQEAGFDFVQRAERYLRSSKGAAAREYLHSRGFRPDTIKQAHLGYCPGKFEDSLENWGLEPGQTAKQHVTIPEGIVIPWFAGNDLWKIAVRRLQATPDERPYGQVVGSSDGLYNVDAIRSNQPVVLLEGEFDALSIIQEASDLAVAVATGGATKAQSARWIARLIQASTCLVAFDDDENKAGDDGADDWLSILPNSLRWAPIAKDVNEMLTTFLPIKMWLELGLNTATAEVVFPAVFGSSLPEQTQPEPLQPQIAPILSNPQSAPMWPTSTPAVSIRSTNSNPTNSKPTFLCKFCKRAEWIWHSVDAEYICSQCFSPAEWTTKN